MKRELQRIEIPGEYDARRRTWEVVRAAYLERERVSWPRRHARVLALAAAAVAIVAAAFTPPGRSVVNSIRDAVGREKVVGVRNAQRELVRLPAPGRLLVQSPRGDVGRPAGRLAPAARAVSRRVVVSTRDVRRRRARHARARRARPERQRPLGEAAQASASLAALVVRGLSHRLPRRLDAARHRRRRDARPRDRPGRSERRARVAARHAPGRVRRPAGRVRVVDADARTLLWQRRPRRTASARSRGPTTARCLLVARRPERQRLPRVRTCRRPHADARPSQAAAFPPGSHRFALTSGPQLLLVDGDTLRFPNRPGLHRAPALGDVAWSPDGKWLARRAGRRPTSSSSSGSAARPKLDAVSNVSRQFGSAHRSRASPAGRVSIAECSKVGDQVPEVTRPARAG